jgi:hypothetical protein
MSISSQWTSIRGKSRSDVLGELALDVGAAQEGALVGTQLPNGWYVITVSLRSAEDPCAPVLAKLSVGCDVVTFGEIESTGYKGASGWQNGSRIWAVTYDPDVDNKLVIEGVPPTALDSVLRADTEKARIALYDVLELSKSLIGFRPDEGNHDPSEVLVSPFARGASNVPKNQSWFQRLFKAKRKHVDD